MIEKNTSALPRSFAFLLFTLVIAGLGFTALANAQDFSGMPGFPPEHGRLYYLGMVVLYAVMGALVGALFSDKAKPFRRILWIVLGVVILLAAIYYSWT